MSKRIEANQPFFAKWMILICHPNAFPLWLAGGPLSQAFLQFFPSSNYLKRNTRAKVHENSLFFEALFGFLRWSAIPFHTRDRSLGSPSSSSSLRSSSIDPLQPYGGLRVTGCRVNFFLIKILYKIVFRFLTTTPWGFYWR